MFVPTPLKLKVAGKDTLITLDIPNTENVTPSKPSTFTGSNTKSGPSKSNSQSTPAKSGPRNSAIKLRDEPVDESDPIDVAMRDRKNAGSTDTVINAADAKKKKL